MLYDDEARSSVYGAAFHCYGGDHAAPAQLAQEFPEITMMFEECTG